VEKSGSETHVSRVIILVKRNNLILWCFLLKNALSIDVEDWYQGIETIPFDDYDSYESRISKNVEKILQILERKKVCATFFTVGYIAENFPSVIEKIEKEGNEIASHGYSHTPIYRQTRKEFEGDLLKSIRILESIVGEKILGYRAPCFSVTEESSWAIDIMEKMGLKYDSSIFPVHKIYLYGVPKAPTHPYRPSKCDITVDDPNRNFVEFPLSTYDFLGHHIPVCGGFYLRFLPYPMIRVGLKGINKRGYPAIIYIHPWELDSDIPKLKLPFKVWFNCYHNLGKVEKKLRMLLEEFEFAPVREVLSFW